MYNYSQSPTEELLRLYKKTQQRIAAIETLPEGTESSSLEDEIEAKLELLAVLEKELVSRNLMIHV